MIEGVNLEADRVSIAAAEERLIMFWPPQQK
jgi:hypothetical protein